MASTVFIILMSDLPVLALSTGQIYKESGADEVIKEEGEEASLWDKVSRTVSTALQSFGKGALSHSGIIFGCLLLLSLAQNLQGLGRGGEGSVAFDFVAAVALGGAAYPALQTVFAYTRSAVEGLLAFSASLLPVMSSLYLMGGSAAEAVSATSGITLFLTAAEAVMAKLVMPTLSIGFALSLTGLLPNGSTFAPVARFLKNAVCTVITLLFSLTGFVFYFQTAVSAATDSMGARTVKFLSGAFIPVIGGAVGESARTVFGAVSAVKATVGVSAVLAMLGYLLPPLLSAVLYRLAFSLCTLVARLLGLEKQAAFLGDVSALLGISLAVLVGAGVVFAVISAVFIKSGVGV